MFLDRARLTVRAGGGGRGIISFRREAHVPRGGPDGGDGGRGGDIVLRVDEQLGTLSEFRYRHEITAPAGGDGAGKDRSGKAGEDLIVRVPPGTIVTDVTTRETIADLASPGEEIVIARGGRGGRGNARFASSTRRTPRIAEDGAPGEIREIELELKLIADVGLAGLPNAGKSTLLAALTRARPKIASYPFTTLVPNLGVARLDERELVVADIPGLIEGAHTGAGLGEEFLRHVERTRLIVHVVDASRDDPVDDIRVIDVELAAHGRGLETRPQIVALNKMDLPEARDAAARITEHVAASGRQVLAISAAAGTGVSELTKAIFAACPPLPRVAAAAPRERRIAFAQSGADLDVTREDRAFRITGDRIERLAGGIDWSSPEAAAYFQRVLVRSGAERRLRALGAKRGDIVRVAAVELEWSEGPDEG